MAIEEGQPSQKLPVDVGSRQEQGGASMTWSGTDAGTLLSKGAFGGVRIGADGGGVWRVGKCWWGVVLIGCRCSQFRLR